LSVYVTVRVAIRVCDTVCGREEKREKSLRAGARVAPVFCNVEKFIH